MTPAIKCHCDTATRRKNEREITGDASSDRWSRHASRQSDVAVVSRHRDAAADPVRLRLRFAASACHGCVGYRRRRTAASLAFAALAKSANEAGNRDLAVLYPLR